MKSAHLLFLVFCLSLASFSFCQASESGVEIVQEIEITGPQPAKMQTTIKGQGEWIRMDIDKISTVINTGTGDILTLMHDQRMAMQIPASTSKAILDAAAKQASREPAPSLVATGKKEKISGFQCEEYVTEKDGSKVSIWITKESDLGADLMRRLERFGNQSSPMQGVLASSPDIDGVPMRIVMQQGDTTIRSTTQSVKKAEFTEGDFQAPKEYTTLAAPKELGDMLQQFEGQ